MVLQDDKFNYAIYVYNILADNKIRIILPGRVNNFTGILFRVAKYLEPNPGLSEYTHGTLTYH